MTEGEQSLLAAEEAVIAMAAHLSPADLLAAIAHLEAEAAELERGERTAKVAAAELLGTGYSAADPAGAKL